MSQCISFKKRNRPHTQTHDTNNTTYTHTSDTKVAVHLLLEEKQVVVSKKGVLPTRSALMVV